MAAPGTQIGVDGRRVPVAQLPVLSAEQFIEQQRLAMVGITEAAGLVVVKGEDETRPSIATPGIGNPDDIWDELVADATLAAPLDANSTYALEVLLAQAAADPIDGQHVGFFVPAGATGAFGTSPASPALPLTDAADPAREAIDLGPPSTTMPQFFQLVGFVTTVGAGSLELAWVAVGAGAVDAGILGSSFMRLIKTS